MNLAWPVLLVFVVFDTMQGVSISAIRGTGQQKLGSYITMSAYWLFGIPIAIICVFYFDFGIRGLWVGPTFACFYNTCCYSILINRIDWEALIVDLKNKREKEAAQRKAAVE